MLVVRIENRNDGCGIFKIRVGYNVCSKFPSLSNRHMDFPTPFEEGLDIFKNHKDWFCAFATIDILKYWVTQEEIKLFVNNGFDIILLEVTEFQQGNLQVIYTKESIISSKIINSIFK